MIRLIRPDRLFSRTKYIDTLRFLHTSSEYDITPEQSLFGPKYREWEHADYGIDNTGLHSPVLSRNNVGLGFLILNSDYGSYEQINLLYRRLRDLEVNIYKRYVVLTSMTRKTLNLGWNPMDILKYSERSMKEGSAYQEFVDILFNLADLLHLVHTYRKPLIAYGNGAIGGYGVSLWSLANRPSAYKHSALEINNLEYGWILDGGLSCVLALLKGCLGEYIGLTGCKVTGSDLIHIGLGTRWISPDAFRLMEQTSSAHLAMSEQDAKVLLEEHCLEIPEMQEASLISWERIINYHFVHKTFDEILLSIKRGTPSDIIESANKSTGQVAGWESRTIKSLENKNRIAANISLNLIRSAKTYKQKLMHHGDISPSLWNKLDIGRRSCATSILEANHEILRETLVEELLIYCLNEEMNAAATYILQGDTIISSVQNYLSDNPTKPSKTSRYKEINPTTNLRWEPKERGWFSLSSVPQLRRLNPNYDNKTGLDYDPSTT